MKTFTLRPTDIRRDWYLIEASGKTLGRLASEIASRLRGKHNAEYNPPMDNSACTDVIQARR